MNQLNTNQTMYPLSESNFIQQVSIDLVIFGYQEKQLKVLVPKLNFLGDFWALPSGFIDQQETVDQAAQGVLEGRTGIKGIFLQQFQVFGDIDRGSKAFLECLIELNEQKLGEKRFNRKEFDWFTRRAISIPYYALVDINKVLPQKTDIDETIEWYNITSLPQMIMDHNRIVDVALKTLRIDLDEKSIAFNLLPESFTMRELQEVYEVILNRSFTRTNFQKRILDMNILERQEKKFTGAANKAPYLYRLKGTNRISHPN